ncbi:hypothetical protein V3C99_014639 [Haemonchus contortus]
MKVAWMTWRESSGILFGRRCSRTLERQVYRAVVRLTMLYGSECWPGKRPRGAPKTRRRDVIKKDLAEAKIAAEDRQKWRRLTTTAGSATARDQP